MPSPLRSFMSLSAHALYNLLYVWLQGVLNRRCQFLLRKCSNSAAGNGPKHAVDADAYCNVGRAVDAAFLQRLLHLGFAFADGNRSGTADNRRSGPNGKCSRSRAIGFGEKTLSQLSCFARGDFALLLSLRNDLFGFFCELLGVFLSEADLLELFFCKRFAISSACGCSVILSAAPAELENVGATPTEAVAMLAAAIIDIVDFARRISITFIVCVCNHRLFGSCEGLQLVERGSTFGKVPCGLVAGESTRHARDLARHFDQRHMVPQLRSSE